MFACACDSSLDAFAIVRLEEIVEGVDVECLQRILSVCSDENERRKIFAMQPLDHFEAVFLRHLYIEKDEIRFLSRDRFDGFDSVLTLADERDVVLVAQKSLDAIACEGFVVDDDGADRV